MINIENFSQSKQIKLLYRIIHEPISSWNAIGKYWLRKLDTKFNENFFLCKCSSVLSLNLENLPNFYRKSILAWAKFREKLEMINSEDNILKQRLFGNFHITFQNKPLFFPSFSHSNLKTIEDVWDTNLKDFKNCNEIYNSLNDKRNCISELSKIKKAIPKTFIQILKGERNVSTLKNEFCVFTLDSELNLVNKINKVIPPKRLLLKSIQMSLNKKTKPKCQLKWETKYGLEIEWDKVWKKLNQLKIPNKVKEFHWKCIHNIIYTEFRLQQMNKSDGKCHFCYNGNNVETLQHLFFECPTAKILISELKELCVRSGLIVDREITEKDMIIGVINNNNDELADSLNIVIYFTKWELWKARNKIKYEKVRIDHQSLRLLWGRNLKFNLNCLVKSMGDKNIDKTKLVTIVNNIEI